ncbi:MAG: hypothetical protein AB4352_24320 [Hormoscilla sp.]
MNRYIINLQVPNAMVRQAAEGAGLVLQWEENILALHNSGMIRDDTG